MKNNTLVYTIILSIIIFSFISWLIYMQIEEFKLQDDPKLKHLKEKFTPMFAKSNYSGLLEGLNKGNLMNKISLYKGDKSYTINKQKVFLCLRDEKGDYYDDMMLSYVFLHEISHCLCDEIGHTEKFNQIFDAVLEEASKQGLYDQNFPIIQDYCQY